MPLNLFRRDAPSPDAVAAAREALMVAETEVERLKTKLMTTRGDRLRAQVQQELLDAQTRAHDARGALEVATWRAALPTPIAPTESLEALQAELTTATDRLRACEAWITGSDGILREEGRLQVPALQAAQRRADVRLRLAVRRAEQAWQAARDARKPAALAAYLAAAQALRGALGPALEANNRVRIAFEEAQGVGLGVDAVTVAILDDTLLARLDHVIMGLETVKERLET